MQKHKKYSVKHEKTRKKIKKRKGGGPFAGSALGCVVKSTNQFRKPPPRKGGMMCSFDFTSSGKKSSTAINLVGDGDVREQFGRCNVSDLSLGFRKKKGRHPSFVSVLARLEG